MARFEDNIMGLVPREEWLDIPFQVTNPNDPIDRLFGDVKTNNIVAHWESIAAEYQVPLMAQFHGFDTEAQQTFRVPVDTHNIEKGLIKVKINQSERMRALLRSGVQNDEMYDYVVNDGIRLGEQVITRTKVAKNELMATGQVTIKENNLDLTIDYGVPAAQKGLTIDMGAGATKPLDVALEELVDTALNGGNTLNGLMTSRAVLNLMRKNPYIQKAINGSAMVGQLVSRTDLEAYLSQEYGIDNVITNDTTYGVPGAETNGRPHVTATRRFPANGITFFAAPDGGLRLGDGLWGDPPETDAGIELNNTVAASTNSPFVYITQWAEHDPAVLWTKASALFIPVLYNPTSLYIGTATNTPGT
jgi:hypothetical protein